jgi:hypothetical protein
MRVYTMPSCVLDDEGALQRKIYGCSVAGAINVEPRVSDHFVFYQLALFIYYENGCGKRQNLGHFFLFIIP